MPLLRRILVALTLVGPATAVDRLDYSVTYRGVFSMGTDLAIADVSLSTRLAEPGRGLIETQLEASSAGYPTVESLYPFRYRFRSWAPRSPAAGVVAFESYQKTGREKHAVFLTRGTTTEPVRRLSLDNDADEERLAAIASGEWAADRPIVPLWDRVGLLQHVRRLPLAEGGRHSFDVTTGRKRYRYDVSVERGRSVVLGGDRVPAWKVRFDGERIREDGRHEPAHRPLYVWISRDADRVPLRVHARHSIGLFRIELVNTEALERLARAGD